MLVDSTGNIIAIEASIRLSTAELRAMALKQQQQIDSQHQLLTAKEQRLRFLKFHDMRSLSSFAGEEKLRKLRERVETQEKKLRQLRSLRGQTDLQKSYNGTLNNDLDSIRALFTEKEKELTLAVAKVEALTRQLEDLRQDRKSYSRLISPSPSPINAQKVPPSIRELEKARRELSLRHQLSLQQNACLHLQRETLQQRQAELKSVDQRIFELQLRLQRRKASNLIYVSKPKSEIFSLHSQLQSAVTPQCMNTKEAHTNNFNNRPSRDAYYTPKGNIAAIEPFVHTPQDCTSNNNFTEYDDEKIENRNLFSERGRGCKKIKLNSVTVDTFAKSEAKKIVNENLEKNANILSGVEHFNNEELHKTSVNNFERNECDSVKVEKTQNERGIELSNIAVWQNANAKYNNEVYPVKQESQSYEISDNLPVSHLVSLDGNHRKPINSVAPTPSSQPLAEGSVAEFMTSNIFLSSSTEKPILPPKPNRSINFSEGDSLNNAIKASSDNHLSKHRAGDKGLTTGTDNSWKFGVCSGINSESHPIKARTLTIKKQPLSEQPKLKSLTVGIKPFQHISKQTDSAETQLCTEKDYRNAKTIINEQINSKQVYKEIQPITTCSPHENASEESKKNSDSEISGIDKGKLSRKVSFDPLALLLDASLEGELELVKKTAKQVSNPSAANDEGITALHNAICAGHFEIVKFLVEFGCDVNAQDSDGWTPLHCAASCNNLAMVKFLVESGACLFASTLSDQETPAEKCEEDEEGFDGCSEYLYNVQEKLGILNCGKVYTVFGYEAQQSDELSFRINDCLNILRKGDDAERDWWWAKNINNVEGYVPRNLLGLYPRVNPGRLQSMFQ